MRSIFAALLLLSANASFPQSLFQPHSYSIPGNAYFSIHDMNRDGAPDIVLFGGQLSVLLNNGHGGFGAAIPVGGYVVSGYAAIADFNRDGLPDIASCNNTNTSGNGAELSIFLNQGGGSFKSTPSITLPDNEFCSNLIAADINGDGNQDLIVPSTYPDTGSILTLFGNGKGSFTAPVVQHVSVAAQKDPQDILNCSLSSGVGSTFELSTRTDLILLGSCSTEVSTAGTIYYATNNSNGTYSLREISESSMLDFTNSRPYVADLNGDGKPDIVLNAVQDAVDNTWVQVVSGWLNQGGGNFNGGVGAQEDCAWSPYCSTLWSGTGAKFNGDSVLDSVFGYRYTADASIPDTPRIVVTDGKTGESTSWSVSATPVEIMAADFNRDGRNDFAALEGNKLVVYLNQGYTCSAPSKAGVHICAPVSASSYSWYDSDAANVSVLATAKGASGAVSHMQIWIDGVHLADYTTAKLNATISLTPGTHQLIVAEVDSKGAIVKSAPISVHVLSQWGIDVSLLLAAGG